MENKDPTMKTFSTGWIEAHDFEEFDKGNFEPEGTVLRDIQKYVITKLMEEVPGQFAIFVCVRFPNDENHDLIWAIKWAMDYLDSIKREHEDRNCDICNEVVESPWKENIKFIEHEKQYKFACKNCFKKHKDEIAK